jgi:hypothetical protein
MYYYDSQSNFVSCFLLCLTHLGIIIQRKLSTSKALMMLLLYYRLKCSLHVHHNCMLIHVQTLLCTWARVSIFGPACPFGLCPINLLLGARSKSIVTILYLYTKGSNLLAVDE